MAASSPEIRAARAFLVQHQIKPAQVSPAKFANSAKEMDVGFRELLRILGLLYDKGQSEGPANQEFLDKETSKFTGVQRADPPTTKE